MLVSDQKELSFPCTKEALNIKVSTGEIANDVALSNLVGMPSGPQALLGSNSCTS